MSEPDTFKREPITPRPAIKKREKIEFIIDTCSSGEKVLKAVDKLLDYSQQPNGDEKPRFAEQRITIPIQIGIERKRRIFPEFLDAELLSDEHGDLERFYQRHKDQITLVETPTSRGFKLFYAFKALSALEKSPDLKERVLHDAQVLAEKYAEYLHIDASQLTDEKFDGFVSHIDKAFNTYRAEMEEPTHQIVSHHQSMDPPARDSQITAAVRDAEHVKITRTAKKFLNELSIEEKLLLQAMYSNKLLNTAVSKEPEFSRYRADKGERAIEEFLFAKRAESDPARVTVIISEDQGARKSIQHLRSQSNNAIFAISSYGLARAMCTLFPDMTLTDIIDPSAIELMQKRDAKTETKIREGKAIGMNDLVEPRIEEKWADRLVEVMRTGKWASERHVGAGLA